MNKVALCVDTASIGDPSLIGLRDENIIEQRWLAVYSSAETARRDIAADHDIVEAWVVGCDDADAINLAATVKQDRPKLRVCLAAFDDSGSLLSRAHAASIDAVYSERLFVRRYAAVKAALSAPTTRFPLVISGPDDAGLFADRAESFVADGKGVVAVARSSSGSDALRPDGRVEDVRSVLTFPGERKGVLKTAFLLPVFSGSGGSGKSTVSALAALCSQLHGKRTLLLDLDFQFGNVAGFFRDAKPIEVDELLRNPACLNSIEDSSFLPTIVVPPHNPEESELLMRRVAELLDIVTSRFDVVVANTGAFWTEQHASLLDRSSKALFLVDQRASSLQACRRAVLLCERCGIAMGPLLFVANRCSKNAPMSSIDVSCSLKGVEAVELRDGGREVEDFSSAGVIGDLVTVSNPLYVSIEGLLSSLIPGFAAREDPQGGRPVEQRSRRRGFFRKGGE